MASRAMSEPEKQKKKKQKKPQKVKARLPRGFVDRDAGDIRALEEMTGKIREVYERYGFDPVETPMFEYTQTLGKFLPDTDRPNDGVFSVQDDDEQWMSLRYDLTAPLARYVAENYDALPKPYRSYRAGYVFRNEKPGPGRFRQFAQFDADTVGAPGVQADAEMCMMMADTMEALGIPRGQYVIRVNNRKVLDGVMEAIGVTDEAQKLAVLRAIDKLDKFGVEGVRKLLGDGRKDESGDYTKGAGLDAAQIEIIDSLFFNISGTFSVAFNEQDDLEPIDDDAIVVWDPEGAAIEVIAGNLPLTMMASQFEENASAVEGFAELKQLQQIVRECGYGTKRVRIDTSVVRGLEYYTGMVYEAELLFPVTNEKGEEVVFGSVGGGGRYDGLVSRFRGEPVPATGFSIGVSRLMTALKNLGKISTDTPQGPVVVCVMDRDIDALAGYQKMVQQLREAGVRAEMFQGNPKQFGKQLQYADRRNSPLCVIQGSDERARDRVTIKDMIEGKREAAAFESNAEYKAARPGQYEVPAENLVAEVKKRLDEQAADGVS
jgi:histidyl-tRNA synthetase